MSDTPGRAELSPVKRAIVEIRELRAKLAELEQRQREPIAIIGMGMRLPGGVGESEAYWALLRDGRETIGPIPPDRWDVDAYYDPDPETPGKMYTRCGSFVERVDQFDPHFFGISPREADTMDPQQRLLLETAWEALEQAGQAPDQLHGTQTGVFVGIAGNDYFRMLAADTEGIDVYLATGNTFSVAAGRISYLLGLHGPSMAIDTACSSSLTAVHLAVQSLRARECDMALVGGVNLILSPEGHINFSKARMMAQDGHCKTFDAMADGYVRGEGCAVVVLKRLTDALAAGDDVLAVVRGSAVNQDGRSSGLTAPNGPAQEAVIRAALDNGAVSAHDVSYVEAHGTGTPLGDPIEIQALGAVFGPGRMPERPLLVGSVKTNLGHLESAAGLAGLIKVVLSLRHNAIPPHLHFTTPNPHIPWDVLPIRVPTELTHWSIGDAPRIAGVSSFGFSGTNAHILVEEAPSPRVGTAIDERPLRLLALSAKSASALRELARRYVGFLDEHPDVSLADMCHTANGGRALFERRLIAVASDSGQLRERLCAFATSDAGAGVIVGHASPASNLETAFLFTGHGSIYPGMARRLYQYQPVFRAALDRCDDLLRGQIDRPLLQVLGFEANDQDSASATCDAADVVSSMAYAQPALFAVQYALGELWRSWGIEPALVAGHSSGEYAAACFAGVFSLEDGLRLVVARGRLMQTLSSGGEMVAVFADEARVRAAVVPFAATVGIAAINGPQSVVVSGRGEDVQRVIAPLCAAGIETRQLDISVPAHSPLIDPILDTFAQVAATVRYSPPRIGLVSTLTGALANPEELCDPHYWRRHLREPVRFGDAMQTLADQGCAAFVEIGPHPTLLGMGRRCLPEDFGLWLPSLRRGHDDWGQILESLATLFVHGAAVDWNGFDAPFTSRKIPLPTYPFERVRCWTDTAQRQRPAADALTCWQFTIDAARRQAGQGPLDLNITSYPEKWECLDALATASIAQALRDLGLFTHAGERHTVVDLLDTGAVAPTYRQLARRWLGYLANDGLLDRDGDTFVAPRPLPTGTSAARDRARAAFADEPLLLEYVLRCIERLPAVMAGTESALDTLFPGGSYETVDYIYHHWAAARYCNSIVRTAVEAVATAQLARPIRVLEIGAGTGGTTAALLPALHAGHVAYYFTDVSSFFLDRARERFAAYPFVRYGLLDIEREPAAQGFAAHSFDVIVAANVLHATRNLDRTLGHTRELLTSGGVLLAYETTAHPRWLDITTGLIEGWHVFEDTWRDDNPLLGCERWAEVLRANGFVEALALPEANAATAVLGQSVLLARAPTVADAPAVALSPLTPAGPVGGASELASNESSELASNESSAGNDGLAQQIVAALPLERHELLVDFVRGHVARVLRLDPLNPPDRGTRLMDLGVDSLMAVELRNRLTVDLRLPQKLPATLIFDYPSIDAIARLLERLVLSEVDGAAPVVSGPRTSDAALVNEVAEVTALATLSDNEVEALLLKKLEGL